MYLLEISIFISILLFGCSAHSCSNNKIPYGLEIYKNGQPVLLCSKPSCFEKTYADCDEKPLRHTCPLKDNWVGGIDKGYGLHQPLYVQCCEYENLSTISEPVFNSVLVRPGEYFEGEELTNPVDDRIVSFDFISNIQMIKEGVIGNQTQTFRIDVRRFYCNRLIRPKRYKPWKWP
uniref:Uncharacterized protein n=1 Tax=Panagrolaimus sp. ES5 TaxID=591445 RepID=A0AC34GZR0_9BILA